jgi:uncharacterized membrane protein YqaE (UPF0057 family)
MLYLVALLLPPLACLGAGRSWHSVLSIFFCATLYGWPIAIIHALLVVKDSRRSILLSKGIQRVVMVESR